MLFLNRTNFRNNSNICNYWWMDCHSCFCWRFTLYLGCSRWCHLSIDSRSQTRRKHWGVIIILFTIFPFFLFLLWGGYVDCLSIAEGNALQQVVVKLGGLAFLVETRCPYPFFSWLSEFVLLKYIIVCLLRFTGRSSPLLAGRFMSFKINRGHGCRRVYCSNSVC